MMLLLPILAAAAEPAGEPPLDCANAVAQQDMNRCAAMDFEQADQAMNAQWEKTSAAMKQWDRDYGEVILDGRPGYYETLLAAQRAWLDYRDRHCASEGYLFRGGSMEPFMVSSCMAALTRERTEQLRELLEVEE